MKILYVTTFYEQQGSSAAIRNNAWVEGLCSLGHDVTVETVDWPDTLKSEFLVRNNKAKVNRTYLPELNILKTTVKTAKSKRAGKLDGLRHFVRDMLFFPDICKNWPKKYKEPSFFDYDVIVSSSDFKSSHFMGLKLKKLHPDVPWIQIWGDPWSSDISLSGLTKRRAHRSERKLLQRADAVVYVSSLTRDYIKGLYPGLESKLHYIPRGYFKRVKKKHRKEEDLITLLYTGGLNFSGRNIIPLLDAMEEYNTSASDKKIKLDIYGTVKASMLDDISKYQCVTVRGSVDYEKILELYSQADMLLFLSNSAESTQIPGKLFDYLGTELPVLCLMADARGPLAEILNRNEQCFVVENSKESLNINEISDWINKKFVIDESLSPISTARKLIDILKL